MSNKVWVVFDRDDFDDFDQAVQEGVERGYQIAWSNQSFEYWLYLHFHYSDLQGKPVHHDEDLVKPLIFDAI